MQLSTFGRLLQGLRDELPGFEQSSVAIADPQVVATSGKTHYSNVTFNGRNDSRVSGTVLEITDAPVAGTSRSSGPGLALLAPGLEFSPSLIALVMGWAK